MSDSLAGRVDAVTVVGAGTMGHGIAQTFATAGYNVTIVDVDDDVLKTALEKIEGSLEKLGEDHDAVLERLETTTSDEEAYGDADLIVEAVPEDIDLKRTVFESIDDHAPERTILATNTSTLPITEIASATDRPNAVVGMHFSNPVQLMEIVEVIRGKATDDDVFEAIQEISTEIEKTPVLVEKDIPGFLINRINLRFWLEAVRQVENGEQDERSIDAAIRRIGLPMGPFEVLDFSGVDVATMAAKSMRDRGVDLHVPDLLEEKTEVDKHGMKTGVGFYSYPTPGEYSRVDIPRERRYDFDPKHLLAPAVNEAAWLLANDVTTKSEIDKAMRIGMNWPRGLLKMADEYGIDRLVETLETLRERSGWDEYEPHPHLEEMVSNDECGRKSSVGFYEWDYEQTTFDTVRYERREYVAWITLDRPEALNALDEPSWEGLNDALEHAANDDEVRATILRGSGRAFCAGDDIAEIQSWESTEDASEMIENVLGPTVETLRNHPKPVIAAVDGVANGGGCELVLLSDLAVASPDSDFALPEAKIGALPPIGLTYGRMSLGKKSIMELALTGDQLTATEAESMGIVNYVVDGDQVADVARELARATTASGPKSVAEMKDFWTTMEDDLLEDWFDNAMGRLVERTQSEEASEGLAAFLEKRDPDWQR
ncbi:3-hydroxyacyl-CoA dehydrogenase [Natronorubrum sediminis]|uniref:3-hydroxyacyl-CoA dehydrogenase n=1 Tax=Natronorubrum sediminis TaxID=640943 RepID=A0A1H6G7W6_9EURY|nr:3-hydroxyacyl-CoA dehydrogenase NAD-binding domain-containing protein [Natronorubrum sediminis]SEH18074.1 3-hydroxyacyl-CoA dehydrogenase [Natronorubrum sediminis]